MGFSIGDTVQKQGDTGQRGLIKAAGALHGGVQYWRVFWGGVEGTRTHPEHELVLVGSETDPAEMLTAPMSGYQEFQRTMTLQRLQRDMPLQNNIFAFNASRTRFFPYQFKPLLKFLESSRHRLLICDEVGLGKTIEAGLILLELRARQTTQLVLVICPSNLRNKWRLEMRLRFGEDFRILGSSELDAFLDDYEEHPDRVYLNGIVSLETIRTPRIRERLEEVAPAFDLLIVDEAHHVRNFGTSQRSAVLSLAGDAHAMVMLTATPVHLGSENLFSLLNILDPEDFPDADTAEARFADNELVVGAQSALARIPSEVNEALAFLRDAESSEWLASNPLLPVVRARLLSLQTERAEPGIAQPDRISMLRVQQELAELNLLGHILTRTRKRDVQEDVAIRRPQSVQINLGAEERRLYDAITRLIIEEAARSPDASQNLMWRLSTPQRRLASSIQGLVEFYRSTASRDDGSDPDDAEAPIDPTTDGTRNPTALRKEIARLVAAWPADGPDSKYDALKAVLHALPVSNRPQKVLIFASFRHTVSYLERRLIRDGFGVRAMSGAVPLEERPDIMDAFRNRDDVQVLISSRVGSEGLDFQFCSVLVNYDLPWNPMEVEQRIGRLDRIGQTSPSIAIINLWTSGTVEERILQRLYDRIGIFERSVGDLEAILGGVSASIQRDILHAALHPEEMVEATERMARMIDRRRNEIERLEASAASFVGVDAFFDEEVAAIRSRRRYVTAEQLRRFVVDFLHQYAPKSRLAYDLERRVGTLAPDERLRDFLRRSGRTTEALNILGAVDSSIAITFDGQMAFAGPHLEFLSVLHPLVQAIAERRQAESVTPMAFQLRCATDRLTPGFHLFFIYRLHITAARPRNSLEAVFLGEDLREACDQDTAEILLGEMVEQGRVVEEPVAIPGDFAAQAVKAAELAFLTRRNRAVERERIANEAFVSKRMASVQTFYSKGLAKKRALLERGIAAGRQERYLRMLRGTITRLEEELRTAVTRLERDRRVGAEHQHIAMGIVEISPTQ
jgi:ATP-dependent helicase HepA